MRALFWLVIFSAVITSTNSHADQYCPDGVREYRFNGIQNNSGQNGFATYTCTIGSYYTVSELFDCYVPAGTTNGSTTMQTPVLTSQSSTGVELNQARVSNVTGAFIGNDRLSTNGARCRDLPEQCAATEVGQPLPFVTFGTIDPPTTYCSGGCVQEFSHCEGGQCIGLSGQGFAFSSGYYRQTESTCDNTAQPDPSTSSTTENSSCVQGVDGNGLNTSAGVSCDFSTPPPESCEVVDGNTVCDAPARPDCVTINGELSCFTEAGGTCWEGGQNVCVSAATRDFCIDSANGQRVCGDLATGDETPPRPNANGNPTVADVTIYQSTSTTGNSGRGNGYGTGSGNSQRHVYNSDTTSDFDESQEGGPDPSPSPSPGPTPTPGPTPPPGECDPEESTCGESPTFDDLGDVRTFGEAVDSFNARVAASPIAQALSGLGSMMPSGGTCPAPSFSVFGQTYVIDMHCQLSESIAPVLYAVMLFAWALVALILFFKA